MLPAAIAQYYEAHSGSVSIRTDEGKRLIEALRAGELDLLLSEAAGPELMPGPAFEALSIEEVVFAARSKHPLLRQSAYALSEFPNSPCYCRVWNAQSARQWIGCCPRIVFVTFKADRDLLRSFARIFVEQNDAIWIVTKGIILKDLENENLKYLRIDTAGTGTVIGMTLRAGTVPAPLLYGTVLDHPRAGVRREVQVKNTLRYR
jgi:LysR family transcriptional regulator, pca operon transcriptional activator